MIGYKSDKGTNGIYYNEYTGEIGFLKDIGFFKRLLLRKMKNNIEINIAIYNRAIYLDKDKGE